MAEERCTHLATALSLRGVGGVGNGASPMMDTSGSDQLPDVAFS